MCSCSIWSKVIRVRVPRVTSWAHRSQRFPVRDAETTRPPSGEMEGNGQVSSPWPNWPRTLPRSSYQTNSVEINPVPRMNARVPSSETDGVVPFATTRKGSPVTSSFERENGSAQIPGLVVLR